MITVYCQRIKNRFTSSKSNGIKFLTAYLEYIAPLLTVSSFFWLKILRNESLIFEWFCIKTSER